MPRFTAMTMAGLLFVLLFVASSRGLARADSCRSTDRVEANSQSGRFTLEAHFDRNLNGWKGTLSDTETKKTTEGVLEKISWHTHLKAFVSDDGSRVVMFEPSALTAGDERVLIYDRKFNLLKSIGLNDLLTVDELGRVSRSISHVHFTEMDKAKKAEAWLEPGGQIFAFRALGGRVVRVDIVDLVVFPAPKKSD